MRMWYVVGFVPEKGVMLRSGNEDAYLSVMTTISKPRISHGLQAVSQHLVGVT